MNAKAPLSDYRILDLTEGVGYACGFSFAELGAEVLKVEKPGGDPTRNKAPFYHNEPHPEKSLLWFAYNLNKKSITLNIEAADGQEIFKKLVMNADVVLESFSPGYLDNLNLGYSSLNKINRRIILTSITPFGQDGPYRDYQADELTVWAEGGIHYISGDPDRPPVQPNPPQAYYLAGLFAAMGTIPAIYHCGMTGQGQWVDAAALDMIVSIPIIEFSFWQFAQEIVQRMGRFRRRGTTYARMLWPCKDGHVSFALTVGRFAPRLKPLMEWMASEGMAGPLAEVDDWSSIDMAQLGPEKIKEWEETFISFFLKHTKEELTQFCQEYGILLMPGNTPKEIVEDNHLVEREFWYKIEHHHLSDEISYPGSPYRFSKTPCGTAKRPPLIGEHNEEIYRRELGLSSEQLVCLKENGII